MALSRVKTVTSVTVEKKLTDQKINTPLIVLVEPAIVEFTESPVVVAMDLVRPIAPVKLL